MSKTADVLIEAAERLELLGFGKEHLVVKNALIGEKPMCSVNETESLPSVIPVNDEQWERIREFEEKHKTKVYHVIRTDCGERGIMEAYLYIPLPLDDGQCRLDRTLIKCRLPFAYVYSITHQELSEFAFIHVEFKHNLIVMIA